VVQHQNKEDLLFFMPELPESNLHHQNRLPCHHHISNCEINFRPEIFASKFCVLLLFPPC